MPPWGTHRLFDDKEIGDIVAFLKTLKSPARFKTEVDDPAKRHAPVETRDNLDPTTNPAMWAVDKGEELYKKREASGFSCATCHGDAGSRFKTWAAAMPKWEPRFDKVIGIEEFVFRHAKATTGATWLMQSDENIAMAVYLRNVANGQEMTVDVASPGAKEAFERGRALAEVKIGALNFSCRDCHDPARGGLKWIRGQWLAEQKGQLDHFPGSGSPSRRDSSTTSRPGAPASTRSGTSANASSGAASRYGRTSCRPTPSNTATSSSIWRPSTPGRSSTCQGSGTEEEMITRREILQVGAAAAAITTANGLGPLGRVAAQQRLTEQELLKFDSVGNITLLHMADLHGQLVPVYLREPSVNIGAGDARGLPPHLAGREFLRKFGIAPRSAAAYALTSEDFAALAKGYGRIGCAPSAASTVCCSSTAATLGRVRSGRCAPKARTWSTASSCSSPTP